MVPTVCGAHKRRDSSTTSYCDIRWNPERFSILALKLVKSRNRLSDSGESYLLTCKAICKISSLVSHKHVSISCCLQVRTNLTRLAFDDLTSATPLRKS